MRPTTGRPLHNIQRERNLQGAQVTGLDRNLSTHVTQLPFKIESPPSLLRQRPLGRGVLCVALLQQNCDALQNAQASKTRVTRKYHKKHVYNGLICLLPACVKKEKGKKK